MIDTSKEELVVITTRDFARFWSKVEVTYDTKCWLWTASTNNKGYGQFTIDNCTFLAHRVAWRMLKGVWPSLDLCHHCDTPLCCNDLHVFEGTPADNMADMIAKGRKARGEAVNTAVLTEVQVVEIRQAYYNTGATQRELAYQYKVSQLTISKLIRRVTWAHVFPNSSHVRCPLSATIHHMESSNELKSS